MYFLHNLLSINGKKEFGLSDEVQNNTIGKKTIKASIYYKYIYIHTHSYGQVNFVVGDFKTHELFCCRY